MQERHNSTANVLELCLSCTNLSISICYESQANWQNMKDIGHTIKLEASTNQSQNSPFKSILKDKKIAMMAKPHKLYQLISSWCHIYVSMNWVSIGSGNALSPVGCQAITWTNADLLSIVPLGMNFSEIWIEIQSFSFAKMHLKISHGKWRPFCSWKDELNTSSGGISMLNMKWL